MTKKIQKQTVIVNGEKKHVNVRVVERVDVASDSETDETETTQRKKKSESRQRQIKRI